MPSDQNATESNPGVEEVQGARLIYKLHGLSWLFLTGNRIRQTIIPLVAFMLFGAKNDQFPWLTVLPVAVVAIVISAFWDQWFYRYGFSRKGLVIRKGLFFRNVRVLDYDRIENVDTERGILHRLLDVADVRVETSSGGRSEAIIRVLDDHAVKELREKIFERSDKHDSAADKQVEPAAGEALLELPTRELVRYGLIDNRGMIIVAALLGVFSQFGMDQLIERYIEPFIERLPIDSFIHLGTAMQVFLVVSGILGLIAGTRVLSILLALVTLHGFKLTRNGDDLRAQYGLLTKVSLTMRRPRIQVVHQRESLLHRWFKRVSLRVDLAGGLGRNSGNQQQQGGNKRTPWLAPVATREKAAELVKEALPVVETDNLDWQKLSPKARFRLGRFLSLCWLIIATPSTVIQLGWWSSCRCCQFSGFTRTFT